MSDSGSCSSLSLLCLSKIVSTNPWCHDGQNYISNLAGTNRPTPSCIRFHVTNYIPYQ
jgi:hypothetical protein